MISEMDIRNNQIDDPPETEASSTTSLAAKKNVAIQYLQNRSIPFLDTNHADWATETTAYNIRLPATPCLVVYAQTAQQVQDVVACGVAAALKISARCGGHSYASLGLGGDHDHLVVDLTRMNSITIDPHTNIATIGAGARLGHIATTLYHEGGGRRAISHGSCPAVGLSGHLLHGGYGWASHNKGLALDWMVGADVVLANGTRVACSQSENADLFWALRGAGSNFGIVTSYRLDTFAAPRQSVPYHVALDWQTEEQKLDGVRALVEFARTIPTELNMRCTYKSNLYSSPILPTHSLTKPVVFCIFGPKRENGVKGQVSMKLVAMRKVITEIIYLNLVSAHSGGGHSFDGVYYGSVDDLSSTLAPLLHKTGGTLDAKPGTWIEGLEYYAERNSLEVPQPYNDHGNFYATSLTLKDLSGDSLANFIRYWHTTALEFPQGGWFLQVDLHGGPTSSVSAVDNTATAYAHRDKAFLIQFYHYVDNGKPYPPEGISLLKGWIKATAEPLRERDWGMYINYVDSELDRNTAERLYYGDNLERLKMLKHRYDPTEVFYYPQSIAPSR